MVSDRRRVWDWVCEEADYQRDSSPGGHIGYEGLTSCSWRVVSHLMRFLSKNVIEEDGDYVLNPDVWDELKEEFNWELGPGGKS